LPSTCVGDARPCAGRGAARARSAAPWLPGAATTPASPSEPGPPLHLRRPLGRCSSVARDTTAVRAGALKPYVNGLIDITFGGRCCSHAQKPPMLCPKRGTIGWHTHIIRAQHPAFQLARVDAGSHSGTRQGTTEHIRHQRGAEVQARSDGPPSNAAAASRSHIAYPICQTRDQLLSCLCAPVARYRCMQAVLP
jgi:hypothetical protein